MDLEKIGKFIKEQREKNNMTQEELAEKIFCVRSNVAHIEKGRILPSYDKVKMLSEIFHVSEAEIYAGRILEKNDGVPDEIYNIISILNSKLKIRLTIIIILIMLVVFFTLIYYFVTFRNSIKVYNVSGQTENFKINNGIFVLTKEKMILSLNINSINNQKIKRISMRYKTEDSDSLVIETDLSYLYIVDYYNYNEYFDYENIVKNKGVFYIEIITEDTQEKLDVVLTKEYTNSKIFLKPDIPISNGERYSYPVIEVPSKIKELFTEEDNSIFAYKYKEKEILHSVIYDADNRILNIIEEKNDWNKSFIFYLDIGNLVYSYSVDEEVKEKYDFSIENMNEQEADIYDYFKENYIKKFLQ